MSSCNGNLLHPLSAARRPFRRAAVLALLVICCAAAQTGCGKKDEAGAADREAFLRISAAADSLYKIIHPLRSSALGSYGCDSLLFTFSDREISEASSRVDSLLDLMATIPASGLGPSDIDLSVLLGDWLRGERFSFGDLRLYTKNPLLFCWMAEEAVCGIPSRLSPAVEGELQAYGKRLSLVPALLENARTLLDKPARINVSLAEERISALAGRYLPLREKVTERYGSCPESFDSAFESITDFGEYLTGTLSSRSRGSFILGTENLAQILEYSESLDPDPGDLVERAEKTINSYLSQVSSITANFGENGRRQAGLPRPVRQETDAVVESSGAADTISAFFREDGQAYDIEALFHAIEDRILGDRSYSDLKGRPRPRISKAPLPWGGNLPVNPYIMIPEMNWRGFGTLAVPSDTGEGCSLIGVVPENGDNAGRSELFRSLLTISSPVASVSAGGCADTVPLRRLFSGQSFMLGWIDLNVKDLTALFPEARIELRHAILQRDIRDLAIMVTVFKLHSGRFTTSAAAEYLENVLSVDASEASRLVSESAAFPSRALPGLSTIMLEDLVKEASYRRGERKPREHVRNLMTGNVPIPLELIRSKIGI